MTVACSARSAVRSSVRHILATVLVTSFAITTVYAQKPTKKERPLVVLISIDGMKPEAVLDAAAHGLKVPNLTRMMHDGVFSTGVTGVLPTLTYPSHTTILTGVSPAKHGIYSNTTFDPLNKNEQGWYWYSEDIKVPTLWDAAHAAGLRTANVYWPVSVGAHIDDNLAQIWRTGQPDDLKLQRAVSTPGLITELEIKANVPGAPSIVAMDAAPGHYPGGEEETVAEDEIRAKYAVELLKLHHPDFMTVYFTGLDTEEHKTGPFSPASNAVLERIDALVGEVRAAAEKEKPGHAFVCVISDHGFAPVHHDVNLYGALLSDGLFTLDAKHKIASWKAMIWPMGGSAAVILHDPNDAATKSQVDALLAKLAADPANGIDRVLDHDEVVKGGGLPNAEAIVSMAPGYELGYQFTLPLVTAGTNGGMHGYAPDRPEMRSSFFLVGPGVAKGKSLDRIDMRNIAPTLAVTMGTTLPTAELPALNVK
jgi:predicted AlkP superfamily pyrophosphatase or phosphodiesterase